MSILCTEVSKPMEVKQELYSDETPQITSLSYACNTHRSLIGLDVLRFGKD